MAKPTSRPKRSKKVVEAEGIAHIKATFNNTVITVTDRNGNTLCWDTGGTIGMKRGPRGYVPEPGLLAWTIRHHPAFQDPTMPVGVTPASRSSAGQR